MSERQFRKHPDPREWDDYVDFESTSWPKKDRRRYWIIPSICFNCESACGILAYVDKETLEIRKIEGHPVHPGSRGRTCAKGVVTPNQLEDPDRVLYPLKRTGARGAGEWTRVTWDEVLDELGGRIRRALMEGRKRELMYHVGRPGEDGYANRVLQAWGLDGHNSHTNVCSASARLAHFVWTGADRPSPDHANARTILLLSSHLESGHYFNPHAQRIIEGQSRGAKLIVVDPRLSNTSAKADVWLPANPGTEGALASVTTVRFLPAIRKSTGCPGMFLNAPRTTRTVTVPAGMSFTGRTLPDISFGFGIATCPCATGPDTTPTTSAPTRTSPTLA